MRVFVVGTGRCGSVTFFKACEPITNYVSAHESQARRVGFWDFDDDHIEVSSHLQVWIPRLLERYPDAKWVHLLRDREKTVDSLARLNGIKSWAHTFFQEVDPDMRLAAETYYDCMTACTEALLPKDTFQVMRMCIEQAPDLWGEFWDWIEADGDFKLSREIVSKVHNRRRGPPAD